MNHQSHTLTDHRKIKRSVVEFVVFALYRIYELVSQNSISLWFLRVTRYGTIYTLGTKSVGPTIKQHFFFGFVLTWVKDYSKYVWIKCPDSRVLKFVHALIFRSFSSSDLSSVQAPLFSSPWYQSTTVSGMLSRFSGNKPSWILSLLPVICAYGMLYNTDISLSITDSLFGPKETKIRIKFYLHNMDSSIINMDTQFPLMSTLKTFECAVKSLLTLKLWTVHLARKRPKFI